MIDQNFFFNIFSSNKKGSAQIWWIIIGAVIALVILVVMMVIFTGRTQPLNEELGNCVSKGGICALNVACPKGTLPATSFTCSEGRCCLGVPKPCTTTDQCGDNSLCQPYGTGTYCS